MGRAGPRSRAAPPCRFRGDGGSVSSRTDAPHHCHAALRCRIMCITESKTLNDFNEVQAQGVLCPPFVGRTVRILRGLQPGIVGLGRGRRLFELHMGAAGDLSPAAV